MKRFGFIVTFLSLTVHFCWAWTQAHDQASKMASTLAPSPFRENPDWCAFGVYPDSMNDWDIAQGENGRWAVWLLVREAIQALKDGDKARACFLASVASHYPQDALCMSHSQVLKMGRSDADPSLLPELLRPLLARLPVERKTLQIRRYGRSNQETISNHGFFVTEEPPSLLRQLFDAVQGYVHDWLEDTAAALSLTINQRSYIVGSETLTNNESWSWQEILNRQVKALEGTPLNSLPDYEGCNGVTGWSFYHRWLTAHYQGQWLLPFALFDWQNPSQGKPKFRDAEGLKSVFAEEFRIAVEATAALYRYVSIAAKAKVQTDWGKLANEDAKLDAMAKEGVAILVAENRNDWKRAAQFLQQEFVFGGQRQGVKAQVHLTTNAEEVGDALEGKGWQDCHLVVMERGESYRLQISQRKGIADRLIVRLQVPENDKEAMGNMVDLFLDEGRAPLWSTSPPKVILEGLQQVWAGAKLMEELRRNRRLPDELFPFVRPKGKPVPFRNTNEERKQFADWARNNLQRTPGLGRWVRWIVDGLRQ